MKTHITREAAWELLRKYNNDPFHLQHALTVEGVMRWYAEQLGYADEVDFWGMVGLLHDIDFEQYPDEHCIKAPELLREGGVGEEMIHAICSHAYGLHVDVKPEHLMEKVLYATDELTGLIWATAMGNSLDASVKKCPGHGTEIAQEEVQVKGLRRRLFSRSD